MKIRDPHIFRGGMNSDDSPSSLPPGDYPDALNVRTGSSDEQHGSGILETLQAEVEVLINPDTLITYYGESIGGQFVYEGFEEVTIGNQTWMKKNWNSNYPGSKVYNDVEANADRYGRLYQHGQVMASNFCPTGWRVPTEADIDELIAYVGGLMVAGGKLKEVGDGNWTDPNTGADDTYGFRAIPGGKFDLLFDLIGENSLLWLQDDGEPYAPEALNGSNITYNSFIANWKAVTGADGYYLDVATDEDFTSMVAGYDNLDVGDVLLYEVSGLSGETQYFYRVRAYNEVGSSVDSDTVLVETTTAPVVPLLDKDGNEYTTVIIGDQEWIIENLRTTKYADGTAIPNLTLDADWMAEDGSAGHDGAYCYYNNDSGNKNPYGALYNWYAVNNTHGLVYFERGGVEETGWRIPTYSDLVTLRTAIGGESYGGLLKEVGTTHWITPNTGATNATGFTAVGAGGRYDIDGSFFSLNEANYLWTTDESIPGVDGAMFYLAYNSGNFIGYRMPEGDGLSVRCVRDIV